MAIQLAVLARKGGLQLAHGGGRVGWSPFQGKRCRIRYSEIIIGAGLLHNSQNGTNFSAVSCLVILGYLESLGCS